MVAPTRFSAKPGFGSTFVNFQQTNGQPGYISEAERFTSTKGSGFSTLQKQGEKAIFQSSTSAGLNTKIGFQQEDKLKSTRLQEAKLNAKRANMVALGEKCANITYVEENKYQQKLMVKAARHDNYNILAHMNS